ncbi:uroporphyrinogen-III synthase [Piscinibacter sp. HJYY11]|uniref:uroporphyrinogen-III synthase n=1 Tax=Piscinibacter sp. HJYY11 TaxID=2801333 RepID=UPI00191F933A|nr:uroporphyrinogen-III synthase [Piscinibacter sp. HJYY11]MBL0727809.1 uroporphyrinogen-III synthase [Piscinibacter sp. HJYY11]
MRVLVTRPRAQAGEWVRLLRDAGLQAEALPLIKIAPATDGAALAGAWQGLHELALVVFVSPNAVSCFFDGRPDGLAWPEVVVAASPGPGTTRVLRALGVQQIVEPAADAPQFDSEALWEQLSARDWQGRKVLIVRGESGRDWLAERLRERGAVLEFVAAYGRTLPALSSRERGLLDDARATPSGHLWLFSSSEAITNLQSLAPDADWAPSLALATHPRITQTARTLGFGRVLEARPSAEAVVACIQSISS